MTFDPQRFARLGRPTRIWAVPAIHGQVDQLVALHRALAARFRPGERIVYLGNMIGHGSETLATIDELVRFRREIIARPEVFHVDIAFLRGAQEEIWRKLLQIQFAPNPAEVLHWMLTQGAKPVVRAYGGDPEAGLSAARTGPMALTRWTNGLRQMLRQTPGHVAFFSEIRRAAVTEYTDADIDADANAINTLLVSAGVSTSIPLAEQGETLWFGGRRFQDIDQPIEGFGRLVRGRCLGRGGISSGNIHGSPVIGPVAACLDTGCGPAGGPLVLAAIEPNGRISDLEYFAGETASRSQPRPQPRQYAAAGH